MPHIQLYILLYNTEREQFVNKRFQSETSETKEKFSNTNKNSQFNNKSAITTQYISVNIIIKFPIHLQSMIELQSNFIVHLHISVDKEN